MKTTMVIPSYWGRAPDEEVKEGDFTYDHPTPLDQEGTLQRCLESIQVISDKDFTLVVLACATAEDIVEEVRHKVAEIVARSNPGVETLVLDDHKLQEMCGVLEEHVEGGYRDLLNLEGYSPVRNMCLFAGHVLGSEITVFIDDDEVFEDKAFMAKCREHIGTTMDGEEVLAVAGYYLQENGEYRLSPKRAPWMVAWDNAAKMNEGFDQIIGGAERLTATPFVFGGNMVIHDKLGSNVPFDPNVPRGEDIDYLMNARMFGHTFFLDNTLAIKHLPPPNSNPKWLQLRKDMKRFAFERTKLQTQGERDEMNIVKAEDFDPYPGSFLKDDLNEKAREANLILAGMYQEDGNEEDAAEALKNVEMADGLRPEADPFEELCTLTARWREMMAATAETNVRVQLEGILRM